MSIKKGYGPLSIWFWVIGVTLIRVIYLWANHRPLGIEEAQYWTWSTHLAWGYHSKGPLIAWLIRFSTLMNGSTPLGIRFFVPFMYAVSSFMIYYTADRLFDRRIAFYSALVFLLLPAVTFSATIMSTDPILLMCWSIALYGFVEANATEKWSYWFLCGVALGLGFLAKYTMGVFLLSLLIYMVIHNRALFKKGGFYLAVIVALAILAPNIIWNAMHQWVTFDHVGSHNADLQAAGLHWNKLGSFIGSQFAVAGPVSFAILLFYIFKSRWALLKNPAGQLLFWQIVPLLAAITLESLLSRAYANWTAPIFIAASIYLVAGLLRRHRAWLLILAIVINFIMALAFYTFELNRVYNILPDHHLAKIDPFKRNRPWPDVGASIMGVRMNHPFAKFVFDNRVILSESMYYGQIPLKNMYVYNPTGKLAGQYDLSSHLQRSKNYFYVTDKPKGNANLFSRFNKHSLYTQIAIRSPGGLKRFYIYHLNYFKGYQ